MPILEVEIVLKSGEVLPADLAARIADEAAWVFTLSPGTTWVKVSAVPPHLYAEDGGGPPAGVHPVFVKVLRARRPAGEELAAEVRHLTEVIAQASNCPSANVHVEYLPDAAGRVAFGGNLVGE
jgi:phenylpyruvate tautomerase PptA (4-oxalocrotonate tautomerase family)